MSDPVRIRDVPHGIVYRVAESTNRDLSGVSTAELRQCVFRTTNAAYRAETSEIKAPTSLYEDAYNSCMDELRMKKGPTIWIKGIDLSDFQYSILERDMYQCERCLSTVMDGVPVRPYLKRDGMDINNPINYFCSCPDCVEMLKWIYKNKNNG